MSAETWPDVPCDEYGYMVCPIILCGEPLHLVRKYLIPLVAEQDTDHGADAAVADDWQVECVAGHVLHTSLDQARHDEGDETSETAPEFSLWLTHHRVNRLSGGAA